MLTLGNLYTTDPSLAATLGFSSFLIMFPCSDSLLAPPCETLQLLLSLQTVMHNINIATFVLCALSWLLLFCLCSVSDNQHYSHTESSKMWYLCKQMMALLHKLLLSVKCSHKNLSPGPFMTPFVQGSLMEGKQHGNMKGWLVYNHHPDPWLAFFYYLFFIYLFFW